MAEKILNGKELEFYKWDGDLSELLQNVRDKLGLKEGRREDGGQVTVLNDEKDVKSVIKHMDGDIGQCGYVNWTSGWAHAEDAMRYLRRLVEATGPAVVSYEGSIYVPLVSVPTCNFANTCAYYPIPLHVYICYFPFSSRYLGPRVLFGGFFPSLLLLAFVL